MVFSQAHVVSPSRPNLPPSFIFGSSAMAMNRIQFQPGLSVWFLAIYPICQAKTGLSALSLKRHLGVIYPTAWLVHHKLMQAMTQREARYTPKGQVQVDDAYLGGGRSGSYHGLGFRKYAEQYLGAFAYRFNWRFDIRTPPQRLLVAALQCGPHPQRSIRLVADDHC
jgi:hypothetical protein